MLGPSIQIQTRFDGVLIVYIIAHKVFHLFHSSVAQYSVFFNYKREMKEEGKAIWMPHSLQFLTGDVKQLIFFF